MASAQDIAAIRLARTPRVGPVTFTNLMARYGAADAALDALPELATRGGGKAPKIPSKKQVIDEIGIAEKNGCTFLVKGSQDFPAALATLDDCPAVLTCRGAASLLSKPIIGVVGSRNASTIGRKLCSAIAADLGKAGFVVASGLARGIDTAAHIGSLQAGTIAVLAGGINRIYPKENEDLYWEIARQGAILSEMPWDAQPTAHLFPRRNRIVSGLSLGVLVVEAAKRSGSLITARLAGEQGRQVYAVPGSPMDPRAAGGNHLIREGAILIRNAQDIIDDVGPLLSQVSAAPVSFRRTGRQNAADGDDASRQTILSLLSTTPIQADELMRDAQVPADVFAATVLELELAGKLERHAGNRLALSA